MIRIADRKRAGVIALLALVIGAAALTMGVRSAEAGDCTDGNTGDVTAGVSGVGFVALNQDQVGNPNGYGFWACAVPPDQGGGVGFRDPNPSNPTGWGFESTTCGAITCTTIASMTGAEVAAPTVGTNAPLSGASGSGGQVGTGSGTCVYANGITNCPSGLTLAGATVAEGDLVPVTATYTPAPPCTGVNNTCIPIGATAAVGQDTTTQTVSVFVPGVGWVSQDIGDQCVQVNATCP